MKKTWTLFIVFLFLFSIKVDAKDIGILIDGKAVAFTESTGSPFADENSRTQVPLRVTMETYGANVDWDQSTQTAIVSKDGITVKVPMNKNYIYVNDKQTVIDTQSVVVNNRIYLPIRFVIEALGGNVDWNNEKKTVVIKKDSNLNYLSLNDNNVKNLSNTVYDSYGRIEKLYLNNAPVGEYYIYSKDAPNDGCNATFTKITNLHDKNGNKTVANKGVRVLAKDDVYYINNIAYYSDSKITDLKMDYKIFNVTNELLSSIKNYNDNFYYTYERLKWDSNYYYWLNNNIIEQTTSSILVEPKDIFFNGTDYDILHGEIVLNEELNLVCHYKGSHNLYVSPICDCILTIYAYNKNGDIVGKYDEELKQGYDYYMPYEVGRSKENTISWRQFEIYCSETPTSYKYEFKTKEPVTLIK